MGWIEDVLKEVPLSAVLKERIALADQKYESAIQQVDDLKKKIAALERENADLRAQIPHHEETSFAEDTSRVLVQMFRAKTIEERDVGNMARALNMERGVMQYHLDRLKEAGFAGSTGGNYLHHHTYWVLTPQGRQYVVERKLI
jgi:DNA-binding transcriptional ArsR family regulator